MKRWILALPLLALMGLGWSAGAQGDAASALLARTNSLRASLGLGAYSIHPALNAAADNHARWMARTGRVSHIQDDGSDPRQRARAAGFPSSWASENIYLGAGASAETAWNWWLGSPVHYAGVTSPNYDRVGIGSAASGGRVAYVMVFGNASGRVAGSGGGADAAPASPAYVLGLDEVGNIKHEVQSGQTLGDIALIYGYTWDDLAYMLEVNGMTQSDIRYLQPGSVFLVPPQDGTFTPTSEPPTPTATPAASSTPEPALEATPRAEIQPTAPPLATREIRIPPLPSTGPTSSVREDRSDGEARDASLFVLAGAMAAQAAVLLGAAGALLRRLS